MSDIQMKVMQVLQESSNRGKTRVTLKDISKKVGLSQMKLKKDVRSLVEKSELAYWTSGSSDYIMLQSDFNKLKEKEEGR